MPKSAWRSNLKIGAFYPPISLEHRASGWSNPYTISSSALNTWVGEELRTIGVGYELDHLGIAEGGRFDYGVNAARVRLERSGRRRSSRCAASR